MSVRDVTMHANVIRIREIVEVKVFPHLDTSRASKGAFEDEVDSIVEQCGRHGIDLPYA